MLLWLLVICVTMAQAEDGLDGPVNTPLVVSLSGLEVTNSEYADAYRDAIDGYEMGSDERRRLMSYRMEYLYVARLEIESRVYGEGGTMSWSYPCSTLTWKRFGEERWGIYKGNTLLTHRYVRAAKYRRLVGLEADLLTRNRCADVLYERTEVEQEVSSYNATLRKELGIEECVSVGCEE